MCDIFRKTRRVGVLDCNLHRVSRSLPLFFLSTRPPQRPHQTDHTRQTKRISRCQSSPLAKQPAPSACVNGQPEVLKPYLKCKKLNLNSFSCPWRRKKDMSDFWGQRSMRAPRKVNDSPSQEPGSQLSTSKSNCVTILNDVYSVFTRYFLFFSSPSLSSPVTMELLLTCSVQSYSAEIEDMPFCFFCYDRNQKEKEKRNALILKIITAY